MLLKAAVPTKIVKVLKRGKEQLSLKSTKTKALKDQFRKLYYPRLLKSEY